MWIMFLNSYVWAAAHLDKDGDQSQRVLRNMDVDQIQKVFTTTLNQVQSLQETALSGLRDQLDWTERPWKSRTLITVVAGHLQANVYVLTDSVLCLGGKCPEPPRSGYVGAKITYFVASPKIS